MPIPIVIHLIPHHSVSKNIHVQICCQTKGTVKLIYTFEQDF